MITQEQAQIQIKERFWIFKNRLVDTSPEYHSTFDNIISVSNSKGFLWEVLELADMHLKADIELRGGEKNLNSTDYLEALMYGYRCTIR
jgi:hypothetical protein